VIGMQLVPVQGRDVKAFTFLHTNPESSRINFTVRGRMPTGAACRRGEMARLWLPPGAG
jgi:hypothetical protein